MKDNQPLTENLVLPGFDSMRIGNGYDVHRLVENRKLMLGGVDIPFEKGLLGHSDADVLLHAVMDSLLSAAGLRDIGVQFPDTDNAYKNISSLILLKKVKELIFDKNFEVQSVSAVVCAQKPKLGGYLPQMKQAIASALALNEEKVNLSATTTEGLGIVGKGEGIASYAVCLLECKKQPRKT